MRTVLWKGGYTYRVCEVWHHGTEDMVRTLCVKAKLWKWGNPYKECVNCYTMKPWIKFEQCVWIRQSMKSGYLRWVCTCELLYNEIVDKGYMCVCVCADYTMRTGITLYIERVKYYTMKPRIIFVRCVCVKNIAWKREYLCRVCVWTIISYGTHLPATRTWYMNSPISYQTNIFFTHNMCV